MVTEDVVHPEAGAMAAAPCEEAQVGNEEPGLQPGAAPYSLEPRLWLYFCCQFLSIALVVNCVIAVVSLVSANLFRLYYMLIATTIVAAVYYREDVRSLPSLTLEIGATSISGPAEVPRWNPDARARTTTRQTIRLDQLDRVRSAQRGFVDRLLGRQYVYSTTGDRIYLARRCFARSDLKRLLVLLGLDSARSMNSTTG